MIIYKGKKIKRLDLMLQPDYECSLKFSSACSVSRAKVTILINTFKNIAPFIPIYKIKFSVMQYGETKKPA